MKNLLILFIIALCGLSSCKDKKQVIIVNNDTDIIVDIGDPAYYPGDYGIDDGVVIINEAGWPIVSVVLNGTEYNNLFIQNNDYLAIEGTTYTGMSYYLEIYFVNGKKGMIHWNPLYVGPQLITVTKNDEVN